MIIKALYDYYDTLAKEPKSEIPAIGFSNAKVTCGLNLSENGDLLSIVDLQIKETQGKKEIILSRFMTVPEQAKRSGKNPPPYFLCDNSVNVLGIKIDKKGNSEVLKDRFESFKELHNNLLKDCDDIGAKSVLNFINKWNPETDYNKLMEITGYDHSLFVTGNIVFLFDLEPIHERDVIKNLWLEHKSQSLKGNYGQCLVTGQNMPLAKLHPNIKGVKNAQSAGAAIVSFNIDSFVSYGKEQSFNAPVSEISAFKYTTALNYILQKYNQRIQIADATTVFWAQTAEEEYCQFAMEILNPSGDNDKEVKQDKAKEGDIKAALANVIAGKKVYEDTPELNMDTDFYILGLSPNNARLSVRFFYQNTFGNFVKAIDKHHKDMAIEGVPFDDYGEMRIPLWKILNETVAKTSKDKKISPLLGGAVMRSIITGADYPFDLYAAMLRRIKCEPDEQVNYVRAAVIKAYLKRKYEDKEKNSSKNKEILEVLQVSLKEESTNTPYRLGRLFAFLEKAQESANPGINATIKDKYFSTASASPRAVFPILMKLNNHHLSKLEFKGKWLDIEIGKVFDGIDEFPAHLNLEDQGLFMLGYYHQRQWFFRKKEDKEIKD